MRAIGHYLQQKSTNAYFAIGREAEGSNGKSSVQAFRDKRLSTLVNFAEPPVASINIPSVNIDQRASPTSFPDIPPPGTNQRWVQFNIPNNAFSTSRGSISARRSPASMAPRMNPSRIWSNARVFVMI